LTPLLLTTAPRGASQRLAAPRIATTHTHALYAAKIALPRANFSSCVIIPAVPRCAFNAVKFYFLFSAAAEKDERSVVCPCADGMGGTQRAGLSCAVPNGRSLDVYATTVTRSGAGAGASRWQHRPSFLPGGAWKDPRCVHMREGARLQMRIDVCMNRLQCLSMTFMCAFHVPWSQRPAEGMCHEAGGLRTREAHSRVRGIGPRMAIEGTGLYIGSSLYAKQWTAGVGVHAGDTHDNVSFC